ncbi:MAG: hypothetical protein CMG00_04970 [Candidatus Marinimicrobia bacterium]|nr:hypothetical protein [Candidatus Neomarinimicrobiota bacterium]|tara:strand:- start:1762 stop:3132 length:1371 start_codon:yes stop_codon:yes gene_type:complete
MKKIANMLVVFSIFLAVLLADRGDLIDYTMTDEMSVDTAQGVLNSLLSGISGTSAPDCKYGIQMYSITYETIDQFGEPTIASGALIIPINQMETLPLLSWHHGTQIDRDSVPSQTGALDILTIWLGSTGYVSALPDFLGLGVSELFHPYQINIPSANAVVDMLFASKQLCAMKDIYLNDQLFLSGYSEGGYVTAAAQKMIEETYSDDFNISGSTLLAGAYDMSGIMFDVMVSGEEYGEGFYLPYVILAYEDTYDVLEGDVSDYFLPEYAQSVLPLFDGQNSGGTINAQIPSVPLEIFKPEFVSDIISDENHPLRQKLRENDLYDWKPVSPTRFIHSTQDELVPVENSQKAYDYFIQNGAENVTIFLSDFGPHSSAAIDIVRSAYYWIDELKNTQLFTVGDANFDSLVNISDIIITVNYIVQIQELDSVQRNLVDINNDNSIDIIDVILIVNLVLSI